MDKKIKYILIGIPVAALVIFIILSLLAGSICPPPGWQEFSGKEVYIAVTLPSYNGALQEGWIEPATGEEKWTRDDTEQALGYEGLLRALYHGDYNVDGVFAHNYWWTDQMYPVAKDLRNDIMHSIRQKDAEQVFSKWSRVFG